MFVQEVLTILEFGQADNFAIPSFCKQVAEIDKSGKDGKIYIGNLSAFRDISDVKYVVRTYRKLLEKHEKGFDVFNVGSGKAYKMEDILNTIIKFSSRKIEIVVDKDKVRKVDTPYICADMSKTDKFLENNNDERHIDNVLKELYEYYLKN